LNLCDHRPDTRVLVFLVWYIKKRKWDSNHNLEIP